MLGILFANPSPHHPIKIDLARLVALCRCLPRPGRGASPLPELGGVRDVQQTGRATQPQCLGAEGSSTLPLTTVVMSPVAYHISHTYGPELSQNA